MNRRTFALSGLSTAFFGSRNRAEAQSSAVSKGDANNPHGSVPSGPPQQVAMLVYPEMQALDLVGPQVFLAGLGNVEVHLVWKDRQPITSDSGIQLIPTRPFSECPANLDILFVPGGSTTTLALMSDKVVLDFLADRGARARFVTSVCTGSIVLGAAGLLRGYKATTHWAFRDVLPSLGATPAPGRVVEDRNRITAGGVTAGIDFGLLLAAKLRSQAYAEMLQLALEYDPQPPFHAGEPQTAPKPITARLKCVFAPLVKDMKAPALQAKKQWPG
jgi:cyclohexyl-isocyanide hydratase